MALNFPTNPVHGDVYGDNIYDSSVPGWRKNPQTITGMPAGSIMAWTTETAPTGWLICNGAAVSRSTYASLFNAIGITYGSGDGSTTFNLPDLRGKVAVGKDSTQTEFDALGETGGNKATAKYGAGTTTGYGTIYSESLGSTGDATSSNLPPYQVVHYIIKFSAGVSAGDSELATRVSSLENKFNTGQNDAPAGSIIQFGGATAPTNWLLCDGSAVSRATWPSLFAAIGTTYGSGDGSTTFNVPDLRGRVAVGKNSGTFSALAGTGGAETHTLTTSQMPSHSHEPIYGYGGNRLDLGEGPNRNEMYGDPGAAQLLSNPGITTGARLYSALNTASSGGDQPHNNLQPYLVVNYIIKATAGVSTNDSTFVTRVGAVETRVGAVETANATTNQSGLVPVIPTSVAVGSGTATVSAGGIVTFSGASSVSLNGCFSGSYKNYRIVLSPNLASGEAWLELRLRSGGSAISGTAYSYTVRRGENSSTASTDNSGQGNSLTAVCGPVAGGNMFNFDITSPQLTSYTSWVGQSESIFSNGIFNMATFGGMYSNSASADGFSITPQSSTLSGTIQVYGYR